MAKRRKRRKHQFPEVPKFQEPCELFLILSSKPLLVIAAVVSFCPLWTAATWNRLWRP